MLITIYILLTVNLLVIAWLIIDWQRITRQCKKLSKTGSYELIRDIKRKNKRIRTTLYYLLSIICIACCILIILNGGI